MHGAVRLMMVNDAGFTSEFGAFGKTIDKIGGRTAPSHGYCIIIIMWKIGWET